MLQLKGGQRGLLGVFLFLAIVTDAEAQTAGTDEWRKTVQAAEQEGRVVIYDNASNDRVYQEFQKKYPGIKIISVVARGDEANIVPITGALAVMNQAPDPNAAKVFVNWFLSREGQVAYQRSRAANFSGADSLRVDISKDDVPPESRRRTGGNFLMLNRGEWLDVRPIRKVITDARSQEIKN
jgi:ABC-type glycerol-3-phosphate transport system substrate-binding protein